MEHVVDQAELLVVQEAPHHGDGRRGRHHGQEEHGAVEAAAGDLAVEEHRQQQRERHREGHLDQGVLEGVQQAAPEFAALEHRGIVLKAHEDVAHAEVAGLEEGLVDRIEDRVEVQHDQSDHGRGDKSQPPLGLALLTGRHLASGLCH